MNDIHNYIYRFYCHKIRAISLYNRLNHAASKHTFKKEHTSIYEYIYCNKKNCTLYECLCMSSEQNTLYFHHLCYLCPIRAIITWIVPVLNFHMGEYCIIKSIAKLQFISYSNVEQHNKKTPTKES